MDSPPSLLRIPPTASQACTNNIQPINNITLSLNTTATTDTTTTTITITTRRIPPTATAAMHPPHLISHQPPRPISHPPPHPDGTPCISNQLRCQATADPSTLPWSMLSQCTPMIPTPHSPLPPPPLPPKQLLKTQPPSLHSWRSSLSSLMNPPLLRPQLGKGECMARLTPSVMMESC